MLTAMPKISLKLYRERQENLSISPKGGLIMGIELFFTLIFLPLLVIVWSFFFVTAVLGGQKEE